MRQTYTGNSLLFDAIPVEIEYNSDDTYHDDGLTVYYNCMDITDELYANAKSEYDTLLEIALSKAEVITGDEDKND